MKAGETMRKIILDLQSGLYAKALQRILLQELNDYHVIISESPEKTVDRCKTYTPYALLMEVTGFEPWRLEDRLKLIAKIKKNDPNIKVVILVDDMAYKSLAEEVKKAKHERMIDWFLFGSVTDSYLAAIMDSL